MAKRIIGIILVIAALGTVLLGIKAGGAAPENKKIIESATVVSDGKVLPENDLEVMLKAHMGKQSLHQWQTGWLVLDDEATVTDHTTVIG